MLLFDERYIPSVKINFLSFAFAYVVIILFSSQCYSLKTNNFHCKLVDSCACKFENEEGYNLTDLSANKDGLNVSIGNLTFHFHPCTDISVGNYTALNDCYEGASVCLYNHTDGTYTNLGLSHEVEVTSYGGLGGPVAFVYTHNKSVTTIKLKCMGSSYLEVSTANGTNKHELLLNSPSACRQRVYVRADPPPETEQHLSTGSVLVIMLIVLSSLYFVGGALALKLLRGAEGREMIPNYDFWVSLPGLVKDGFIFTLSGCNSVQAYDRI